MVRKNLSIIDPALNNCISDNLYLSLKISDHQVDCAVFNSSDKKIIALETWSLQGNDDFFGIFEALESIVKESDLFKRTYQKTLILIDTPVYTLVPEKVYQADEAKKYLELNHTFNVNEKINVDDMLVIASKNIYLLPFEIDAAAKKLFLKYGYKHITSVLINSSLSPEASGEKVLVNISAKRLDIVISKEKKLLFCNSFVFETAEDIIYYLLHVYQQLQLDAITVPVLLSGDIEKRSIAFEIIYKYIKNVSFCRVAGMKYFQDIQEIPEHINYCLFNSFTCAS